MMKTKILTLKILGAKRQKILGDNQIFFPPKLLVHCSLRNSGYKQEKIWLFQKIVFHISHSNSLMLEIRLKSG